MPEEGVQLTPHTNILSAQEINYLSELFVKQLGITKIRLTGGEPLVRKDILDIVKNLSNIKQFGLKTIGMTTNGLVLNKRCSELKQAGRINFWYFNLIILFTCLFIYYKHLNNIHLTNSA